MPRIADAYANCTPGMARSSRTSAWFLRRSTPQTTKTVGWVTQASRWVKAEKGGNWGYASHRGEEEVRAQHHHLLVFHRERPVETPVLADGAINEFPRDEVEAALGFPPLSR